ncbi:MAG: 3TM-type holin [Pseudomonadota bacterium]
MIAPAIITTVGGLLTKALDLFEGDDKREAELALKQLDQLHAQSMGQQAINQVEAAHSSIFVAGWRPFIGWVCDVGLAYEFLLRPLFTWLSPLFSLQLSAPPSVSDVLLELVFALLDMGALRSFEKYKGVSR